MSRLRFVCFIAIAGVVLSACGEGDRATRVRKTDTAAWDNPNTMYRAPGWTGADQPSWEAQLRQRNQAQNEYTRVR